MVGSRSMGRRIFFSGVTHRLRRVLITNPGAIPVVVPRGRGHANGTHFGLRPTHH